MPKERLLKFFDCEPLRLNARFTAISAQFRSLAEEICSEIDPGPERTVALRKLLESREAAVRATLHPGG